MKILYRKDRKNNMKKLNKKGFTLVELLAVIVVLALLMVVAGSSIGSALENSKKSALKTQAQKVLTSAAQDAVTANLLDSTLSDYSSGVKTEGDYKWLVKGTVTSGVAKITEYCVTYGKYSIGGTGLSLESFSSLENLKETTEAGSCSIDETKVEVAIK